ncbi:pyridine nucleotide-disulfide oxidoreductase [Gordonia sp. NPDC003585]|mgnify:FL=1|uniref:pyridine nucleotide-disulfide oxidoreductase n=1 Tax=Gordonia sp. NPDC003585 TaxID=3154275 RepID=UPI0033BAC6FD
MNTDTTSEAITYIDDAPRSPRPMWRLARSGAVTLACMSFALVAACSFSIGDDDAVENSDDISIGECLQIGDSLDGGKVKATKVDCDTTDGLSFYAAEIISENAQCGSKNTSTLTFADGDKKLCMTPNFETTSCYQIPLSGGSLVDYRKVDCGTTAKDSTIVAQSVTRADESVSCTTEQTKWSFKQPSSIGYCLRPVTA